MNAYEIIEKRTQGDVLGKVLRILEESKNLEEAKAKIKTLLDN